MSIAFAFFDESGKFKDHRVVSFGGVAGGERTFGKLISEWRSLLRRCDLKTVTMKQVLRHHVRLSDKLPKQTADERVQALLPFVRCLRAHAEIVFMFSIDVAAFQAMPEKAKRAIGGLKDPQYLMFLFAILALHRHVAEGDGLSLVCDDTEEMAPMCYRLYRNVKKLRSDIRPKLAGLTFADDEHFPALQMADMIASLGRMEAKRRFFGEAFDYGVMFDVLNAPASSDEADVVTSFWDKNNVSRLASELAATVA